LTACPFQVKKGSNQRHGYIFQIVWRAQKDESGAFGKVEIAICQK
jgi:hypothetical protein